MKILQINCVYATGSTGKITQDIHTSLIQNGFDSVVCYGRGIRVDEQFVYKTCGELYSKANNLWSRFSGLIYGGCALSTNKLISIIQEENPDVVHLQCLNGYFVNIFRLIDFLKKTNVKTVLTLHAEFMHTANCGHALDCEKWRTGCGNCPRLREATKSLFLDRTHTSWKKMKDVFTDFNDKLTVVSVSPWLMDRALQSPILSGKHHVTILNGLDTEIFKPYKTVDLKESLGISSDEKVIFHATPNFNLDANHIKGGYYVVELAKKMQKEKVRFIIAGNYDKSIDLPANMLMMGRVNDQEKLAQLYSLADVTLLTSRRETFSMVVAESLCCGTPVVGFQAGAPEQIAIKEFSAFLEYGNIDALETSLINRLQIQKEYEKIATIALGKYSKNIMAKKYVELYKEI